MNRPIKTNPAYASLAYRKAIVQFVSSAIRTRLIGLTGDPPEKLMCEDVFPVDAEVPAEELVDFVRQLAEEEAKLDLEMGKFEFTRRAYEPRNQSKEQTRKKNGPEGGRQGNN
jgi:hypothetical protein